MKIKYDLNVEASIQNKNLIFEKMPNYKNAKLIFPEGLTEISSDDFKQLKEIKDGMQKYNDVKITCVQLPSTLTIIPEKAFYEWNELEEILIPASVKDIGIDAFRECNKLKTVTFEENSQLKKIGHSAFRECNKLKTLIIPASVLGIGEYAFKNCFNLTSVIFEDKSNLIYIGHSAFIGCQKQRKIILPDNVKRIESFAFNDEKIKINVPEKVFYIGESAFSETSVTTQNVRLTGLQEIEENSFVYAKGIKSLNIKGSIKTIAPYSFAYCNISQINIEEGVEDIQKRAFVGNCFKAVKIPKSVDIENDNILDAFDDDVEITQIISKGTTLEN